MKYQIYDVEDDNLMSDYPIVEAKTGKEAILKYLKKTGRNYKIRRSGGNDVLFRATPFIEKDGVKIRAGNNVWYAKDWRQNGK